MGGKDRALGLDGHVGGIAVPAHVALEHLDRIVRPVVRAQGPVGAHVGDRRQVELQRPEPAGESDLVGLAQMLAGKDQQAVVQPDRIERGEGRLAQVGEFQPGHDGPERRRNGLDAEGKGVAHGLRSTSACAFRGGRPGPRGAPAR